MAIKKDLKLWVIDAPKGLGGSAHHIQVAKYIWDNHEAELKASGDLLYTWQYDMRWAADTLRREKRLQLKPRGDQLTWRLMT